MNQRGEEFLCRLDRQAGRQRHAIQPTLPAVRVSGCASVCVFVCVCVCVCVCVRACVCIYRKLHANFAHRRRILNTGNSKVGSLTTDLDGVDGSIIEEERV